MNKTEFHDLLRYISTRPDEAAALSAILESAKGKSAGSQEKPKRGNEWMESDRHVWSWGCVSDIAEEVKMSTRWVRDKLNLLPSDLVRTEYRGKTVRYWLANPCVGLLNDIKTGYIN